MLPLMGFAARYPSYKTAWRSNPISPRHCCASRRVARIDRLREAIRLAARGSIDCFVAVAPRDDADGAMCVKTTRRANHFHFAQRRSVQPLRKKYFA